MFRQLGASAFCHITMRELSYLKSSRDAGSVKGFQQVEKRGKLWEHSGKQEKIVSLLPGPLSFFELGPGVLE